MHLSFYHLLTATTLIQSGLSPLRAAFTLSKVDTSLSHDRVKLVLELERVTPNLRAVDGMLLEHTGDGGFLLRSPDRDKVVTEDFLSTCAPAWADRLREEIAAFNHG